jgi:hypothetical protein
MTPQSILPVCFLLLISLSYTTAYTREHDAVRLRDVEVLTFNKGAWTTFRRSSAVPQLKCIGGSASTHSDVVQTIQCRNVGFDGTDVNWKCETNIKDQYDLGKSYVTCEGYEYPDDPYVLNITSPQQIIIIRAESILFIMNKSEMIIRKDYL